MRLQAAATRMELLRLRKRLVMARRGHKLLKDKQDQLMKRLMEFVEELRERRLEVEREITEIQKRFLFAVASIPEHVLEEALLLPRMKFSISVSSRLLMNVRIPVFEAVAEGKIHSYGFFSTSGELDESLLSLHELVEKIIDLAQREKAVALLADEIERTRRRVNALEYVLIPSLEETIKAISMKLSEIERADLNRLMRVKEVVRAH